MTHVNIRSHCCIQRKFLTPEAGKVLAVASACSGRVLASLPLFFWVVSLSALPLSVLLLQYFKFTSIILLCSQWQTWGFSVSHRNTYFISLSLIWTLSVLMMSHDKMCHCRQYADKKKCSSELHTKKYDYDYYSELCWEGGWTSWTVTEHSLMRLCCSVSGFTLDRCQSDH